MTERYFVFDEYGWTELSASEADAYGGDGCVVTVTDNEGVITLDCAQYYSSEGVLKLTISQPIERALATFAALLAADTRLETESGR